MVAHPGALQGCGKLPGCDDGIPVTTHHQGGGTVCERGSSEGIEAGREGQSRYGNKSVTGTGGVVDLTGTHSCEVLVGVIDTFKGEAIRSARYDHEGSTKLLAQAGNTGHKILLTLEGTTKSHRSFTIVTAEEVGTLVEV